MDVGIGLDLGGTDLKFALVTRSGRALSTGSVPTIADKGTRGLKACLATAVQAAQAAAKAKRVRVVAIGMGLPGAVRGRDGLITVVPPQIPRIRGLRTATELRRLAQVPAAVENDATVAALAEARCGAGRGRNCVLMVTVGTGLGGGLVVHGRVVRGAFGTGGEIGHGVFVKDGLACRHDGADGRGCLELYTSATALVRIHAEHGGEADLTPREIVKRARAGARAARAALRELGTNLGLGLATAAALVAPDVIVVGGGFSNAGRLLLDPVRAAFKKQTLRPLIRGVPVVLARLRNDAGCVGAGLLGLEEGV